MTPVNRSYPDWHYDLYRDLLQGHTMKRCSGKYSVSEAQITAIFYGVTREAKGLPPLPLDSKVLEACDQRVFPMEVDDEPDEPPQ